METWVSEMASTYVESRAVNKPTAQEEVLENYNNTLKRSRYWITRRSSWLRGTVSNSTVVHNLKKLKRKVGRDLLQDLDEGQSGENKGDAVIDVAPESPRVLSTVVLWYAESEASAFGTWWECGKGSLRFQEVSSVVHR